ncbi:MAG: tRNA (adenosine(37)-N6)-threonylcarbamoyltransferase complex dimerization subunit type 1 TsaB [Planctomycetaceae bacterium]|nr:tRNA (adenosine(37)-N6)-threonylcarbamoyltransferase complex dimerization subunit type 1 TsaB [Planctomycetaceae bacterium]
MLIAAIETSGRSGSIALCETAGESGQLPATSIETRSLDREGRRHARTLVAELDRLFRDHGQTLAACEAIAVSIGPGSFTGLRVGLACAKTLAWATGCRILAVDTLQCVAAQAPADVEEVLVISDAQRGDVAVRTFRRAKPASRQPGSGGLTEPGQMEPAGALSLLPADVWCGERSPDDYVSGPAVAKYQPLLEDRCRIAPPEQCQPGADSLLRLAIPRLLAGAADDAWTIEPAYTRRSAAEEKADAVSHGH